MLETARGLRHTPAVMKLKWILSFFVLLWSATSVSFYVGDDMSHCGEDAFQLARTNVGWKIIAIADTRRNEECQAPPANQ